MDSNRKQVPGVSSFIRADNRSTVFNLESFTCLWLDQNVHITQDNQETLKEFRQIINHLRIFDNANECEQYIQQITHEKIILIVSGFLGRQIIPRLHDLPQLAACYVFCHNKQMNEEWAKYYRKVSGIFVQRSELVAQISKDQIFRAKVDNGPSVSVLTQHAQSIEAQNAIFMWFQLFIEVLVHMHQKPTDRNELVDICKKNYSDNPQELSIIDEFEKNYRAERAIW
ncbi:unnamed protein product [Rotaria sp. Silwood2]|nr:unnamed protein product [Rotaria sp. Silwood2]CAF4295725.1 unnamed protein product [Rotaria sp. Silwood2]CAF4368343.1 unnamed protein product [Rotaria sp. Silwood2]